MGEVIPFPKPRRSSAGQGLCRSGRHRWELVAGTNRPPLQGRRVLLLRCRYCSAIKHELR